LEIKIIAFEVCMYAIDQVLKTQFLEYVYVVAICHKWYDSVDELMSRHIMLGNWRMGRFLTAATIVESLFHFVSALVRYIQQSSASLGFS
jgi:hypothetical protein